MHSRSFMGAGARRGPKRRVPALAVVAVMVLALALPALAQGAPPCKPGEHVTIPDAGLRHGIEDTLRLPMDHGEVTTLSCEDMLRLTHLELQSPPHTVGSLEGLQYAANLTWLKFSTYPTPRNTTPYHDFSDLTPLAKLTKLRYLWIFTGGKITDLTPLSNLKELQFLYVDELYPTLVDATPLEGLTGLREYGSGVLQYRNLEPFTRLLGLDSLWLSLASIQDLGAFRDWAQPPRVLNLSGNRIADVSVFRSWAQPPKVLNLSGNFIADVTPLADNPAFTSGYEINLERNCLGALPGMGWPAVEELLARGVKVEASRDKEFPDSPGCRQAP